MGRRLWGGAGWGAVVCRAIAAGLLALLTGATIAAPALIQLAHSPSLGEREWNNSGATMVLRNRVQWLQDRGELTGYIGPIWYVSPPVGPPEEGTDEAEVHFYSQAEAESFASTRPGAQIQPSWAYGESDDSGGELLTESDGSPLVAVIATSASTDQVLYSSPTVHPVQDEIAGALRSRASAAEFGDGPTWVGLPDDVRLGDVPGRHLAVACTYDSEVTHLPYGKGVLADVAPLPPEATFRVCGFRTTAMSDRLREVAWQQHLSTAEAAVGGVGMGVALLVGGVGALAEGIRRRTVRAALAELPELLPAGSGPMAGLTDGVNVSLARARAAVEHQRSFVADAAHELRSPLSSLITTLEVAERYPHLTDQRSVTATSLTQARRLERLTQDLLTLARADARAPLRLDSVDLTALAHEVAADHRAQRPTITVIHSGPALVVGDPDALRQVLANVVGNAVRHAATSITVTVEASPDRVDVIVADDGAGVAVADRDRIFDRFTRLDDARGRDAGGSGLGLAIARDLARRHRGDVTVQSSGPPGAAFRLSLPTPR